MQTSLPLLLAGGDAERSEAGEGLRHGGRRKRGGDIPVLAPSLLAVAKRRLEAQP